MLDGEEFILFPIVPIRVSGSTGKGPPTNSITPSISTNFEAKRNAAKINSYFINTRFFIKKLVAYAIFMIVVIAISNLSKGTLKRKSTKILDDRTTQILMSLGVEASVKVNQVLNRSVFFSKLFAELFNDPSIIELSQDNAQEIELMMRASKKESDDLVFWWDLATEDGDYFTLENGPNGTIRAMGYGWCNKTNMTGINKHWIVTDEFPAYGYPYTDENSKDNYCFFKHIWYYLVSETNVSSWVGPYVDTIEGNPAILLSFSSPFYNNGTFFGTTSHTVSPGALHHVLSILTPSKNSRLLLIDGSNNVLASNNIPVTMEVFNMTLVSRDIISLEDPIWTCALEYANSTTELPPNFTCNIQNTIKSYILTIDRVYLDNGNHWDLVCAICLEDFSEPFNQRTQKTSQITNILIIFTITAAAVFLLLRHTILAHFKRNFASFQTIDKRKLFELDQIIKNTTNKVIITQVKHIYADLVASYQTLFYSSTNLLNSINNKSLRELIVEKFAIPVMHESSTLSFRRLDSKTKTLFRGGQVSVVQIDRLFIQNNYLSYVINMFIDISSDLLFSNEELSYLIKQIFYGYSQTSLAFLADSFNFLGFLLTHGLPSIYSNCDLTFSIFFVLLLYHRLMQKRFQDECIPYHYVIQDTDEIYTETDNLLENFKNIKIKKIEYDFKRWKKIVNTIISLIPSLMPAEHIAIPKTFRHIIKRRSGVLFKNEELMYLSCLLIISQYSYFFHSKEQTQIFLTALHGKDESNLERFTSFEENIKTEYLRDAVYALSTVIDPEVFVALLDNINIEL